MADLEDCPLLTLSGRQRTKPPSIGLACGSSDSLPGGASCSLAAGWKQVQGSRSGVSLDGQASNGFQPAQVSSEAPVRQYTQKCSPPNTQICSQPKGTTIHNQITTALNRQRPKNTTQQAPFFGSQKTTVALPWGREGKSSPPELPGGSVPSRHPLARWTLPLGHCLVPPGRTPP